MPGLRALHNHAQACGAGGLELLSRSEAQALEPQLHCHTAMLSPNTASVDSHALMATLLADAEASGAVFAVASRVVGGRVLEGRGQAGVPPTWSEANQHGDGGSSGVPGQLRSHIVDEVCGRAGGPGNGIQLDVEDLQSGELMQLQAGNVVICAGELPCSSCSVCSS